MGRWLGDGRRRLGDGRRRLVIDSRGGGGWWPPDRGRIVGVEYSAVVEFDGELGEADVCRIMDDLRAVHGVLGWRRTGRPHATVTVDEPSLPAATRAALAACERAFGRPARAIEVLPRVDFDARDRDPEGRDGNAVTAGDANR